MRVRSKPVIWLVVGLLILFGAKHGFELQFGLTNNGQEFGTYGQYNRVLRMVEEMDGYEVVNSRLSRRLDWRNLGHLDSFVVNMRHADGRTGSIEFLRGSPEMEVRDRGTLETIIRTKFDEQAGRVLVEFSNAD